MITLFSGQSIGQRERQEDALKIVHQSDGADEGEVLLIVSDGMGGHAGGDVASKLAIDEFLDHFQNVSENMRPRGRLEDASRAANAAIRDRIASQPELSGMGCTLLAVLAVEDRIVWCSIGDSVLFHLRNGQIRRLNADHSYFGELLEMVEQGQMTLDEARAHPSKNALRSAITGEPLTLIDINTVRSEPGDIIILASDGLETLTDDEIAGITYQYAKSGAGEVTTALLDAVAQKNRPKQDNTSLIVFQETGGPKAVTLGDSKWSSAQASVKSSPSFLPFALAGAGVLVVGLILFGLFGGADPVVIAEDPVAVQSPQAVEASGTGGINDSAPINGQITDTDPAVPPAPDDPAPVDPAPAQPPTVDDPENGAAVPDGGAAGGDTQATDGQDDTQQDGASAPDATPDATPDAQPDGLPGDTIDEGEQDQAPREEARSFGDDQNIRPVARPQSSGG